MNSLAYDYYEWMCDKIEPHIKLRGISYKKLLRHLHDVEFFYILEGDENREQDGIDLAKRYAIEKGIPDFSEDHCSVLEMMVALAVRMEEQFMYDSELGDRTSVWFWEMIRNLGLKFVTDDRYDPTLIDNALSIFMNRMYKPNGEGGLFIVEDCYYDLTEVEIWLQANWYIEGYINKFNV